MHFILQSFCPFTYVTAHSPTIPSLCLRHSSFSNHFVALPTSQLILQPFRCYIYVTAHSPILRSLFLRHRLFTYVTWRAALLILQPFRHFTYVTAPSTLPLLHLRHSTFSNPSFAFPTSQTLHLRHLASRPAHSPTFPSLHLRHSSFFNFLSLFLRHTLFTYVTWRGAHDYVSINITIQLHL